MHIAKVLIVAKSDGSSSAVMAWDILLRNFQVAFDWGIRIYILKSGFRILQSNAKSENGFHIWEIRPEGWISIKKFKSGSHGFPFYRSIGNSKPICKTILVNSGLLFTNYACACKTAVPKDSFSNPFSDFPIELQKGKSKKSGFGFLNWNPPWGRISRRWNPFSDFAFDLEIRS